MSGLPKFFVSFLLLGLFGWLSWSSYLYFFDEFPPEFEVQGFNSNGAYCGEVPCLISGRDRCKVAEINVMLDGRPIVNRFKIGSREFEHPFPVNTSALPNGKHELEFEVTGGGFHRKKSRSKIPFYVDNLPLQAAFVKPDGEFRVLQGRTLHLQLQTNKSVKNATANVLSGTYECTPESENSRIYEAFIPVPCEEQASEYPLIVEVTDLVGNVLSLEGKLQVVMFPFKKERLAVPSEKVAHEKEVGRPQSELESILAEIASQPNPVKFWSGPFYAPIEIARVSTEFGALRTTREKGRYMHKALDILNSPGSVVWASHDGKVVVKDRFVESGNTVVVDHGKGVISLYFHLGKFADIEVGDFVKRGAPLGTIGQTGYATGYHLHWEIRVNNIAVDPLQWTKQSF